MKRCLWCENDPLNQIYHDQEWGVPVVDDARHFEYIVLEMMQSGLSWLTVLRKRVALSDAFYHFNPHKIKYMTMDEIDKLMENKAIIRHRKKIEAVIHNAALFIDLQEEWGSFNQFIWLFVKNKPIISSYEKQEDVPSKNELSIKISSVLKKKGFKYLGPVTVYSYLQVAGIINDHLINCDFKKE